MAGSGGGEEELRADRTISIRLTEAELCRAGRPDLGPRPQPKPRLERIAARRIGGFTEVDGATVEALRTINRQLAGVATNINQIAIRPIGHTIPQGLYGAARELGRILIETRGAADPRPRRATRDGLSGAEGRSRTGGQGRYERCRRFPSSCDAGRRRRQVSAVDAGDGEDWAHLELGAAAGAAASERGAADGRATAGGDRRRAVARNPQALVKLIGSGARRQPAGCGRRWTT